MITELSEEKKNDLREKFQEIAENDKVQFYQLPDLMKNSGVECTEAELQDLVNDEEIDEKGRINCETFIKIVDKQLRTTDSEEELLEVFKIFDKDGSQLISTKKLLDVFKKIDENIKEEEVLQMMKECDIDKDGYLNFEEFCRMVKNK